MKKLNARYFQFTKFSGRSRESHCQGKGGSMTRIIIYL
jgi:hypothetical protein